MRWVAATLGVWACFDDIAVGLVLKRASEDPLMEAAVEEEVAREYMNEWKPKRWDLAKRSCDLSKLPETTDQVISGICGMDVHVDKTKCVCNLAKAHSCHVGCRKIQEGNCPSACQEGKCYAGDPSNGGVELSGGLHRGQCHFSCSKPFGGGARYCGKGYYYTQGMFEDCTGCKPLNTTTWPENKKKKLWLTCMADCFPTPSCAEMCGEGTADCKAKCVEDYKHVVEPYWDIFKGSLHHVPLLAKDTAGQSKGDVEMEGVGAEKPVEEDHDEEWEDEDDWNDEEWEDEGDDSYYDDAYSFQLNGAKAVGSDHSHGHTRDDGPHHHQHGKRKRRTLSRHKDILRKARALGLAPPPKRRKSHH